LGIAGLGWPIAIHGPNPNEIYPKPIGRYITAVKPTLPEPEIVTRKGKPVSVIIPIKEYEELLERVEDAEDIAWLKRARRKPVRYRPLEDYLAERQRR
jgi:prevent-host-death family protein